jgi:hypothetical protein
MWRTAERSWLMKRYAVPSSRWIWVRRRGRLVEHHDLGLGDHRPGDPDALLQAPADLRRVELEQALRQPDPPRRRPHPARALGTGDLERAQRLLDQLEQAQPRVQRLRGFLEHQLQLAADLGGAHRAPPAHVPAAEQDGAGGRPDQAEDAAADGGFARARFADERHGLGLADIEGHIADGVGDGLTGAEIDRQILNRNQGVVRLRHLKPWLWRGPRRRNSPARFR